MNIRELKQLIENLPDDMPVVECRSGNVGSWTTEPELGVGIVYKFQTTWDYGINKGKPYDVEFSCVYKDSVVNSMYDALIFYTCE